MGRHFLKHLTPGGKSSRIEKKSGAKEGASREKLYLRNQFEKRFGGGKSLKRRPTRRDEGAAYSWKRRRYSLRLEMACHRPSCVGEGVHPSKPGL